MQYRWIAYLTLAGLVFAVYAQTVTHSFLNFDDQLVITENRQVQSGLGMDSLRWAWTTGSFANWMPLTWMSHQLDWTLYGPWAGGHHLTNVFLHIASVLLLFSALWRMTGHAGASFFVAGLYAVHPLHVESVAWISERKGLLSTFFWMLALRLYAGFHGPKRDGSEKTQSDRRNADTQMAILAVVMVCGLLAKQMVVTLPVALLLLDFWPLGRWNGTLAGLWSLTREKAPLFFVSVVFSVIAFVFQSGGNAVASLEELPAQYRLSNAIYSAATYLRRVVWPSDLSVFYPHPVDTLPMATIVVSGIVLVVLSVLAVWVYRKLPFVTVGWFWYLLTLLPVIGFVPIGRHGMADRYSDIPLVGIYVALIWSWRTVVKRLKMSRAMRIAAAGTVLTLVGIAGFLQTSHWRTSETLFTQVLKVSPSNAMALNQLGAIALGKSQTEEALKYFDASVAADPGFAIARRNRALLWLESGRVQESLDELRLAAAQGDSRASFEAARLEAAQGNVAEAIRLCEAGVAVEPDNPEGLALLGYLYLAGGRTADAEAPLQRAVELAPEFSDARRHLAVLRLRQGRIEDARLEFLLACAHDPDTVAEIEAIAAGTQDPVLLDILAACLSQVGRHEEAVTKSEEAIRLAKEAGDTDLVRELQGRLSLYVQKSQVSARLENSE